MMFRHDGIASRRRRRELSLIKVLLRDGHKASPDWFRRIHQLLEDGAAIETEMGLIPFSGQVG
jgi:hypothetical protein